MRSTEHLDAGEEEKNVQTLEPKIIVQGEGSFAQADELPMVSQARPTVGISVVCPFFNEEEIIEDAITTLVANLENLGADWELIVVNDGSTDHSREIAARLCETDPRLRLVSYPFNRGRGHALRQGISLARGGIIITTEIDLSWGEDIVQRLYQAARDHPEADIVVASPNLPGGGYKNVPWKRVFVSRLGNQIIRALMTNAVTMNTGMTRAYRRESIRLLPLEEDRKEFHLEVIMKAEALKYRLHEIPCTLEWKDYKHEGKRVKRKSSSKINRLIVSHTAFSLFAKPIRYVWGLSASAMVLSAAFLVWSLVRLFAGLVSVFTFSISLSLALIAVVLLFFGVIAQQGSMIQREIWTLKQGLLRSNYHLSDVREFRPEEEPTRDDSPNSSKYRS